MMHELRIAESRREEEQAKRREEERSEESYREFLKSNKVTRFEMELDDKEQRKQRRAAMRFAKDMQDSMPD